jgi:hypothetical protein
MEDKPNYGDILSGIDAARLWSAIDHKRMMLRLLWNYYDGKHPIRYLNPKWAEAMRDGVVFNKNWCQVVVNAARDRLGIAAWTPTDDAVREAWDMSLSRIQRRVHTSALVTGEAYVLAWPDETGRMRA